MKLTFVDAVRQVFVNWRKFRGNASRREYWFFVLFTILLGIVLSTIESVIWPPVDTTELGTADLINQLNQPTPLSTIAAFILLIPTLSVTSRRLQDAGWSGKWLYLYLAPIIPLAIGTFGAISYLESVAIPTVEDLAVSIAYFVPALLVAFIVQIFILVLCILPTKPREAGNRFAVDN
jgi:uncharacterized membrane protein YhaH (DUF805 family)